MIALEILVNGHHVRTVTVGEVGMLNADVAWHRVAGPSGPFEEACRVIVTGIEGVHGDSLHWPDLPCKVGDSITVRIIETTAPGDAPRERRSLAELEAAQKARE